MIKKMMLRKIIMSTSILLIIFLLYLIPTNENEIDLNNNQRLEYIYPNDLEAIYLVDTYNNLTRSMISVNNKDTISKVKSLLEELTIDGKKKDIIPSGFKPIIPKNTKINNLDLDNGLLKINFSKEFYNVTKEDEQKLLEAITYTLTSIDDIDRIEIFVESKKLTKLPNSNTKLPDYFDKNYGINKQYELTTLNNIDSYTIYYVMNLNDEVYYTPVTKYINNQNQDKVKIIIDELSSSLLYETNLMSYLDSNVKLLDYEMTDKVIKLNFNDFILSDITNNLILEEVMYTIGLSLCDEFDLEEVIFNVDNQQISTFLMKNS